MNASVILLASLFVGPVSLELKTAEDNPLYQEMLTQGVTLGGEKRELPPPLLGTGVDKEEEHRILLKIVGGNPSRLSAFLQDAKVAPTIMKTHDVKTKEGTLCARDVWFVVYSSLGDIDTSAGPFGDVATKHTSDEGGIKVVTEKVDDRDLAARGITLQNGSRIAEIYVHQTGELFGDVFVAATNHVLAAGDNDSWVIAFRTDPRFNDDSKLANFWHPTRAKKGKSTAADPTPYEGGCSYTKFTKLKSRPGALLVETHFAYWEPWGWFEGGTPLRSKLQAAADGHARRFRTELEKRKQEAKVKTKS